MRIHRRGFIERLGLGAGAALLTPITQTFLKEARGAVLDRKRFIVFSIPNGSFFEGMVPAEHRTKMYGSDLIDSTSYTMPPRFEPLLPYRDRMMIVDGLVNDQGNSGHEAWDLLSCAPKKTGQNHPNVKSFDQHVAEAIGKNTAFASIHLGVICLGSNGVMPKTALFNHMFAKGPGQPIPVVAQPNAAFKQYFGGSAGAAPDRKNELLERRKLLDFMADDIRRLRTNLAGPEKAKLDEYVGAIGEMQTRLTLLETAGNDSKRCGTADPGETFKHMEDVFEAHLEIGATAVLCGLTNVLTLSFTGLGRGLGKSVGAPPLSVDLHSIGHGTSGGSAFDARTSAEMYLTYFSSLVARLAQRLSSLKEGDRSVFDNSVILYANDNAERHHSDCFRYPALLIGHAGGRLRTEGRYLRYPARSERVREPNVGPAGMRPMGDLMSTLGHAVGAPVDDWGKNGAEKVHGPLTEILVR